MVVLYTLTLKGPLLLKGRQLPDNYVITLLEMECQCFFHKTY